MRQRNFALAFAVTGAVCCIDAAAGVRAFVASYGSDANVIASCAPTMPCRSFNAALGVVNDGGEIVAIDAAGYGSTTITKSVTLVANPGFYAGVAASAGTAITIDTPSVKVTLRGLNINNTGGATAGISMTAGSSLSIENCVISNISGPGIVVNAANNNTNPISVRIVDTVVRNSAYGVYLQDGARAVISGSKFLGNSTGVWVTSLLAGVETTAEINDTVSQGTGHGFSSFSPVTGATVKVWLNRITASGHAFGVMANSGNGDVTVTVANSSVTGGGKGLVQIFQGSTGSATLRSLGNNVVQDNNMDIDGTVTAVGGT
jgi:hypothetical protein